ncbi:MAG: cobalamin-binding protein [Solirubrobacteraceae bacterium]
MGADGADTRNDRGHYAGDDGIAPPAARHGVHTSLSPARASRSYAPRIASLVPHATELLFALGLGPQVVAVTHECDHPPAARKLPRLTRDVLPPGLSSAAIDAAVRDRTAAGEAIYELDELALAEAAPDIVVTQSLCPVCAVSYEDVVRVAERLPRRPEVIALDPHTLGETLSDIRTIAEATGVKDAGVDLVREAADRIDAVKLAVRGLSRPRILALEWLDPIFVAGHWTPQMIELAGGDDLLGQPGGRSEQLSWEALAAASPEIVLVMPCGYDAPRALEEAQRHAVELRGLGADRIVAVDAAACFSRPGPRLLDGLELLADIFHAGRGREPRIPAIEVELSAGIGG